MGLFVSFIPTATEEVGDAGWRLRPRRQSPQQRADDVGQAGGRPADEDGFPGAPPRATVGDVAADQADGEEAGEGGRGAIRR